MREAHAQSRLLPAPASFASKAARTFRRFRSGERRTPHRAGAIKADIPDNNGGFFSRDWNDNLALDLVIEVPQSIALDVEDGSGDSKFVNVGPLKLVDGSGDIEIRGAKGNVSVEDGSGDMTIENVEGSVRVRDGSGGITGSNINGDFIVEEDGSGGIDVNHIAGNFTVEEKGSGSISSSDVKGKIDIPERHRRRRNGD